MSMIKDIEIFAVGTWVGSLGPMKWTDIDLDDIVRNTNILIEQGTLKPRLKIGHSEQQIFEETEVLEGQEDGDPSLGKVLNFKTSGSGKEKKIKADFDSMPGIIFRAIEAELYTSVSAELEFSKGIGWFVSAVALLGADTPAVKTLDDLQAFIANSSKVGSNTGMMNLCFSEPNINGGIMPEPVKKETPDTPNLQDPTVVKDLFTDNTNLRNDNSEKDKMIAQLQKDKDDKDAEADGYKKLVLESKFTEQKNNVLAPYAKDVENKKLMPAVLDKIDACLEEQKAGFSDTSKLSIDPDLMLEIVQAYSENTPSNQEGEGSGSSLDENGNSPDEVLDKEIKNTQGQFKMTYKEASDHIALTKPELFKAYHTWTDEVSALGKLKNV